VPMTPDDVREQTFKERFKGYDVEEVDAFLERVMDALEELNTERDEMARQLAELRARPVEHPAPAERAPESEPVSSDLVSRTLLTAQRAADETISRAQQEADRVIGEAREEAARKIQDAQQHITAERERLETEAARVARVAEGLVRFRAEYRARVEEVISDQLALLERSELPDVPEALRGLATFSPETEPPAPLPPGPGAEADSGGDTGWGGAWGGGAESGGGSGSGGGVDRVGGVEPGEPGGGVDPGTLDALTESSALRDPVPAPQEPPDEDPGPTRQMQMPTERPVGEG
jgi:DivIVA domain-containing protein